MTKKKQRAKTVLSIVVVFFTFALGLVFGLFSAPAGPTYTITTSTLPTWSTTSISTVSTMEIFVSWNTTTTTYLWGPYNATYYEWVFHGTTFTWDSAKCGLPTGCVPTP